MDAIAQVNLHNKEKKGRSIVLTDIIFAQGI